MARKTTVITHDDLDGTEIDDCGGTVLFGFGGQDYEIDLSQANQARLSQALAPYITHGRKRTTITRPSRHGSPRGARYASPRPQARRASDTGRIDTADIREWARREGYDVGHKGRLPNAVIDKYDQCHARR